MRQQPSLFTKIQEVAPEFSNIQLSLVDYYGGEEQGTEYYSVYKFTEGDEVVYARFDGYYQSHYGTDFLSWYFVKPVQVVVTQYERI